MREGNSLPICRVEEGSQSSQKQPRQSTQITQSRGKAGVGYFFASESSPNTSCVRGCGAERMHDPVHKLTPLCDGLTAHLVESDV